MKLPIGDRVDARRKTGVVVLAAGASVRMGSPKQLLLYRGKTLVRRAAEAALASAGRPVVVVVGAHAGPVKTELERLPVLVAENRGWRTGMSSSIRVGLEALVAADPESDGAVVMLCDQPFVDAGVVKGLIDARRETGKYIVASEYGEARGAPVLFSRELFEEVAGLNAAEGARRIIENHPQDVATVSLPEAAFDIDTPHDFALLKAFSPEGLGMPDGEGQPGSFAGER
jgi:molybdenum cofactor cytidylyltransferase